MVIQQEFVTADLNSPEPFNNFNSRLNIHQAIFNLGGITGEKSEKISTRNKKKWSYKYVKAYLSFEIKSQYFAIYESEKCF